MRYWFGQPEYPNTRIPFTEVLKISDLLVVICPLTAETRGLIGRDELVLMKADALLVNCARGGIVEEAALADALRQRVIAGAGVEFCPRSRDAATIHCWPPTYRTSLLRLTWPERVSSL
jgi:lactate dehydrogenase-like 2-hydroxyacid dehydrogenase